MYFTYPQGLKKGENTGIESIKDEFKEENMDLAA